MTDTEFQVLDELYFVSSYRELAQATGLPGQELEAVLQALLQKGYVRMHWPNPDTEVPYNPQLFGGQLGQAYFLATKSGLLAHNSR